MITTAIVFRVTISKYFCPFMNKLALLFFNLYVELVRELVEDA